MKRGFPEQGLLTIPSFAKSQHDKISVVAEQHIDALRQGLNRT